MLVEEQSSDALNLWVVEQIALTGEVEYSYWLNMYVLDQSPT